MKIISENCNKIFTGVEMVKLVAFAIRNGYDFLASEHPTGIDSFRRNIRWALEAKGLPVGDITAVVDAKLTPSGVEFVEQEAGRIAAGIGEYLLSMRASQALRYLRDKGVDCEYYTRYHSNFFDTAQASSGSAEDVLKGVPRAEAVRLVLELEPEEVYTVQEAYRMASKNPEGVLSSRGAEPIRELLLAHFGPKDGEGAPFAYLKNGDKCYFFGKEFMHFERLITELMKPKDSIALSQKDEEFLGLCHAAVLEMVPKELVEFMDALSKDNAKGAVISKAELMKLLVELFQSGSTEQFGVLEKYMGGRDAYHLPTVRWFAGFFLPEMYPAYFERIKSTVRGMLVPPVQLTPEQQRIKELETRVRELEAQLAARRSP